MGVFFVLIFLSVLGCAFVLGAALVREAIAEQCESPGVCCKAVLGVMILLGVLAAIGDVAVFDV